MIGATRYFGARMWAPRYWMKVGAAPVVLPTYLGHRAGPIVDAAATRSW